VTRRAGPSREVVWAVLRSVAIVAMLVFAYYQAPLDRPITAVTWMIFGAVLLALAVFVAVAVRSILRSTRPRLQAARALLVGLPVLIVLFAAIYCVVDAAQADAFTERLSRTDGLYFTVTVFATVGFGDITAVSELARVLVTLQMVVGMLAVGVIARVLLGAVQVAEERQGRERATPLG
jgi:voltage-gated potassium channel